MQYRLSSAILLTLGSASCQANLPLPPEAVHAACATKAVVAVLPEDPDQITLGDLRDVAGRLKACRGSAADAGGS